MSIGSPFILVALFCSINVYFNLAMNTNKNNCHIAPAAYLWRDVTNVWILGHGTDHINNKQSAVVEHQSWRQMAV